MQKNNLFTDILTTVTKYLKVLVVIVVAGIFLSGIRVVKSGEVALVLRFGKLVGDTYEEQVHEPGLLLAFPYIIDEVIMVPTSNVMEQSVTTYYSEGAFTKSGAYVITGDQNIAVLSASAKYMVSDPVSYALNVKDIPSVINASVSTAMLTEAANYDVDDLLTTGKDAFARQTMRRAQEKLDTAGVGITLATIELTQVVMPAEVRLIYDEVNAATVRAATTLENARSYRANLLPEAEGEAAALISAANANQAERVSAADKALTEFWGLLDEYKQNPEVVKTRVFNAKVAKLMQTIGKVRVVQDGETKIILDP